MHFSAGAASVPPVLLHSAHSPVQVPHTTAAPAAAVFLNPTLHAVHVPTAASQVPHPVALAVHGKQAPSAGAD